MARGAVKKKRKGTKECGKTKQKKREKLKGGSLFFKRGSARVKEKTKKGNKKASVGCLWKGLGVQTVHRIFWIHLKYIFILKLVYPHYSYDFAIFYE